MFRKVLIAEDLGSINKGILSVLNGLQIEQIVQAQYCDEAYLKIRKAALESEPFDLLITDLSFKADHREQRLSSGEMLVNELKLMFPMLKVIVYSVEERLQVVRTLVNVCKSDAYVCKGRKGLDELKLAIEAVCQDNNYLSPQVTEALSSRENLDINNYDLELLRLLAKGWSQDEISNHFKSKKIFPNSLSSVEKRLNKLKIQFQASNSVHLVVITKDMGLI